MRPLLLALPWLVFACNDPDVDAILDKDGDPTAGARLFVDNCAVCHGEDGSGDVGPSLIYHVPKHPDAYFVRLILDGRGDMPSFEDLSDQEVADLLSYLRLTFGEQE